MTTSGYGYGAGHDATVLTAIESAVTNAPLGQILPLGSVRRRTLNQHIQTNGTKIVKWFFAAMSQADFERLIISIFGDWDNENADLTIDTRAPDENFHRGNVVANRPVEGEDYQRREYGAVEGLTLTFRDFDEIDGGGGFSTGFSLGFEA